MNRKGAEMVNEINGTCINGTLPERKIVVEEFLL